MSRARCWVSRQFRERLFEKRSILPSVSVTQFETWPGNPIAQRVTPPHCNSDYSDRTCKRPNWMQPFMR